MEVAPSPSPDSPGLDAAQGPPPKPGGSHGVCGLSPEGRGQEGELSTPEASCNPLPNKQCAGRRVLRAHSFAVFCTRSSGLAVCDLMETRG